MQLHVTISHLQFNTHSQTPTAQNSFGRRDKNEDSEKDESLTKTSFAAVRTSGHSEGFRDVIRRPESSEIFIPLANSKRRKKVT